MKKFEEETHVVHNMLTCCSMWLATRPREQHIAAALLATLALVVKMDEHIGATNAIERLVWSQLDPEEELRTLVFEEVSKLASVLVVGAFIMTNSTMTLVSIGCSPTSLLRGTLQSSTQCFQCSLGPVAAFQP